jgi:uncharacterized protein YydD (DUF2326 family)
MNKFENFLLNEDKNYLGNKVSDILSALQDIQGDIDNLGSRHLSKLAEGVINQIRTILHSNWNLKNIKYLKELQKIGVFISKTIEEKGDLKQTIPAATKALEELAGKIGAKINDLTAPEVESQQL